MFEIKDLLFTRSKEALAQAGNTQSFLIAEKKNSLLRYNVVNTSEKQSWSLVKNVNARVTWWKAFTLSENSALYHDEAYFINSAIKSSFSYKGFNKYKKLPSNILWKKFNLSLEEKKPPRFFFQDSNRCYNYIKSYPYKMNSVQLNSINNQVVDIHSGNLCSFFSKEISCLTSFYRNRGLSKRKRIFMLHIREFLKKKQILMACGVKKKKKS